MSNEIDIDALLADEPETKDLKDEGEPAVQKSTEEKADEDKEKKALKRELKRRQEEIDRLKAEKEAPKESKTEVEPVIDENDPAAKVWIKKVNDVAQATIKPILDASQKRAAKSFIERHPEYATGEYKSKLKECVAAADGKVEEGEILEAMNRTWAAQNWQELERAAARRDQGRANAQKAALKATSTGEGVRNEDDFTEEESAKAAKLDMTVEEYRRARADLLANSYNI